MKKNLTLYLIIFLLAALSSCKKSDDSSSSSATSFTGKVDGSSWTAKDIGATFMYGILTVTGKSSTGASIIIRLQPYPDHETDAPYNMFPESENNVLMYMEKDNDPAYATNQFSPSAQPGMVTLTKFDKTNKKVSGSFTVKVKRILDGKEKTITATFENVTYSDKVPPTPGKVMTAKVDGATWTASSVYAQNLGITKMIQIVANASDGSTIGINLTEKVTAGTYSFVSFGDYTAQYNPTPSTFMMADSGSITITSHDKDAKVIKGTFSFVAKDGSNQKNITNGSFVAVY